MKQVLESTAAAFALAALCACAGDFAKEAASKGPDVATAPSGKTPLRGKAPAKADPGLPPHFDELSGLMLPRKLGDLTLVSAKQQAEGLRGSSLIYSDETKTLSLELSSSPLPEKNAKEGIASQSAKSAFLDALRELSREAENASIKDFRILRRGKAELPSKPPLDALRARISFERDGARYDSLLLVSVYKEALLRLTFTEKAGADSDSDFQKLLDEFAGLLYKSGRTEVETETKEAFISAVDALESAPLSRGVLAAPAILRFTKDSPDVIVAFSPATLPWLAAQERLPHQDLLLAAFVGGNARRQLKDAVLRDSPLDGLRCVFKVYKKIRESEPGFRSPTIERLMSRDADGGLEAFFLSISGKTAGTGR